MGGAARYRARVKARAEKMEAERRIMEATEAECRKREAREAMEADWLRNKSLYICTCENFKRRQIRYRVQVIKLSDLLSFSDTPITILSSRSKSKSKSSQQEELREVAFIDGEDLLWDMGFGIFGSRIVLAGGNETTEGPNESYVLETDPSVEPKPRFIGTRSRECQPHYAIPEFKGVKPNPSLVEIKGKLYALPGIHWKYPAFEVFDPETKVWTAFPTPPIGDIDVCRSWHPHVSFAVVGTKILLSSMLGPTFCFDVADPERSWYLLKSMSGKGNCPFPYCEKRALVLDLEDDRDKLVFSFDIETERIRVDRMMLSNAGEPIRVKPVADILVHHDSRVDSHSFAHLGGRKVCFLFMDWRGPMQIMTLSALTFEFVYSKSAAVATSTPDISSSSDSDPYFLHFISICGSFSAKALGYRSFKYNWTEESSIVECTELEGCFVL